jgi:hypothetical protein
MQIGIISPTTLLSKYSSSSHIQYCYGEIAVNNSLYLEYYSRITSLNQKKLVLLDWSPTLPRSSKGYSYKDYHTVRLVVNPTHIVLPCVEFNKSKTLEWVESWIASDEKYYGRGSGFQYLGIVQGSSQEEIESCARILGSFDKINLLGVPSSLELVCPRESLHIQKKKSLLLEIYGVLRNEVIDKSYRGIVSSLPIRLGIENKSLSSKCSKLELDFNYQSNSVKVQENVADFIRYCKD